jgi:hypothetical protein
MIIKIHPHAKARMQERGASEDEVIKLLRQEKNFLQNLVELDSGEILTLKECGEEEYF